MATIIGELATIISARTQPFERAMQRSRSQLQQFKGGVRSLTPLLAGVGAASLAGSVIIARREMRLLNEEFKEIDTVAKLATRIGETTENISRLQFAAELTGTGANQLNKALDVMEKRLGEAARGAGAAQVPLRLMGLDVQKLIQMKPAQQFVTIAEGVRKLGTRAEQAAATANIFSRSNQALFNTLIEGREGLARMAAESDQFGNTVRNSGVAAVEESIDGMTRLGAALRSSRRIIATELAPVYSDLVNTLAETLPQAAQTAALGILGLRQSFAELETTARGSVAVAAGRLSILARMTGFSGTADNLQSLAVSQGVGGIKSALRAGKLDTQLKTRLFEAFFPRSPEGFPDAGDASLTRSGSSSPLINDVFGFLLKRRLSSLTRGLGGLAGIRDSSAAGVPQFGGAALRGSVEAERIIRGNKPQERLMREGVEAEKSAAESLKRVVDLLSTPKTVLGSLLD